MELQWPLIIFTTFISWSAGIFGAQAYFKMRGRAEDKPQLIALIASVVVLAVGGVAVLLHLARPLHIFNGFGNPTSGITQELIAIIVLFIFMVVYFALLRRNGAEKIPSWLCVVVLIVGVVLVCVMGHSYMMPSRPAWDSVFQPLSLVGCGIGAGVATMAVVESIKSEVGEFTNKATLIALIVNAVILVVYIIALAVSAGSLTSVPYWFDPTSPTLDVTAAETFSVFSASGIGFTLGSVITAVAAVGAWFMGKRTGNYKVWGIVAVVLVLASAMLLRCLMYAMGITVYPFFSN